MRLLIVTKQTNSVGLAPGFGVRENVSASSSFGMRFTTALSDTARRLKAAFRSTKPGSQIISGSPDVTATRNGRSGVFGLQQFERVAKPAALCAQAPVGQPGGGIPAALQSAVAANHAST